MKDKNAQALGKKGGIARAKALTAKQLSDIGRKGGSAKKVLKAKKPV